MSTESTETTSTDTTSTDTTSDTTSTDPAAPVAPDLGTASLWRVVKDQRKTELIALAMAVASFWLVGGLGKWQLASCIAVGLLLGLANHLATELWLLRIITTGKNASRGEMIRATIARLLVLTLVAVGLAVWLWPDGIGLLLGLAIFRLLALAMTSVTLLKELKSE